MPASVQEFHYRLPWRAQTAKPGAHPGRQPGAGQDFQGYAPLTMHPDARRLDLRASLKDPFSQLQVRIFRQRGQIPVYVLADLSASMGFSGTHSKREFLTDFTAAAALSAYRRGDLFGFVGCDHEVRHDLWRPASHRRGVGQELAQRLSTLPLSGTSAEGLCQAAPYLSCRRALVFLVSDFHLPLAFVATVLRTLTRHDVVPIVLWSSQEYRDLPAWGFTDVEDRENGIKRTLFFTPALRQRFAAAFSERRRILQEICVAFGREPCFFVDRFEAEQLTRYFLST
jgi:uncharacterized protein (DUF58 family)